MKYERIKELRIDNNLTQQQIANILKVKRGTYASWECGTDLIPINKLYNLAKYYSISIDYLLELSNNPTKIIFSEELNKENIGHNISSIRKKHNLSQEKFANSININQSTLWAYEKGKTLITTATLIELSKKYSIKIDYILINYYHNTQNIYKN